MDKRKGNQKTPCQIRMKHLLKRKQATLLREKRREVQRKARLANEKAFQDIYDRVLENQEQNDESAKTSGSNVEFIDSDVSDRSQEQSSLENSFESSSTENQNSTSSESETSTDAEGDKKENRGKKKRRKESRRWFQSNWPIEKFNATLPLSERKIEWIKFRDQFKRVTENRGEATDKMKIQALEIYAGAYLLSVIKMIGVDKNGKKISRFEKIVKALDSHFDGAYDKEMERIKFSDMKQGVNEAFSDWALRLQQQTELCGFSVKRQKEEMRIALMRRSKKRIADKLFEMSNTFKKDLNKFMIHGNLLDNMEANGTDSQKAGNETEVEDKPVNLVKSEFKQKQNRDFRSKPYERYRDAGNEQASNRNYPPRNWVPQARKSFQSNKASCDRCGGDHSNAFGACPATGKECYNCGKQGHFGRACRQRKAAGNGPQHSGDAAKRESKRVNKVDDLQVKEEGLNSLFVRGNLSP